MTTDPKTEGLASLLPGGKASKKTPKPLQPCQCFATYCYSIAKGDTPETLQEGDDPNEVVNVVYGTCGRMTSRTFAPGHDARLKGLLLSLARQGKEYAFFDGGLLVYTDPMVELAKREWSHFLVDLKPRAKRARKAKATKVTSDTAGDLAPKPDFPKSGFHPVRVKLGRWVYDASVVESLDGTPTVVEYANAKGEVKQATIKANQIVG